MTSVAVSWQTGTAISRIARAATAHGTKEKGTPRSFPSLDIGCLKAYIRLSRVAFFLNSVKMRICTGESE